MQNKSLIKVNSLNEGTAGTASHPYDVYVGLCETEQSYNACK
jgi:hypothetical protein